MTRIPRNLLAVALSVHLAAAAQAAELPEARRLIDAHIAAVGGAEALAKSGEGTTKARMQIVENGMHLDTTVLGRGADRSILMAVPGIGDFRSGYSGGVAWGMDPANGPRLLQGAEREQLIEQSDVRFQLRDPALIASAKTVALSESEGRPCYRVEIVWVSGRKTADCYSSENGLLLSNESTAVTPMGEIGQVSHFSDYREYGAAKLATTSKTLAGGMTQVITLVSVDPTPPAADALARPAAIEALVAKSADNSTDGAK